jgi:colicin import membrane protein
VAWHAEAPVLVSAELWSSVPEAAAPEPAPPPPAPPAPTAPLTSPVPRVEPAPPEAEIAIERTRQRQAEAGRRKAELEAERQRVAAASRQREQSAREARAEEERLARQRKENLERMMGQAGGASGSTAAQSGAPTAAYLARVAQLIRDQSVFTGNVAGNPAAEVEVRAASGGTIISRRLVKSSGTPEWDEAVLRAIEKVATLPRDTDGRVPTQLIIAFRPHD